MSIQSKFLRLRQPAALGDRIDGWRVCWLGGWDRCRVFFLVMVERQDGSPEPYSAIAGSYDDPLR